MDINTLKGKKVVFLGDCARNMANSWIHTAAMFDMEIALAGPEGFAPTHKIDAVLEADGLVKKYVFTTDAKAAAKDADVLCTDVWVSMGDEAEAAKRKAAMTPYQVNGDLLALAKSGAYFLHCLPAHAGEEVSQEVLDSPQSIIFDEAENRLHAQKAIMAKLVELNS
jgi:ornithine carbamoyltransferase